MAFGVFKRVRGAGRLREAFMIALHSNKTDLKGMGVYPFKSVFSNLSIS